MKVCTKCEKAKPLDEFHKQANTASGHRPDCKACVRERQQQNYSLKSDEYKRGEHRKNACPECGKPKTRVSLRCQDCARPASTIESPNWRTAKSGYVVAEVQGKFVLQHRYVLENHLGRKLLTEENVHHINGVRDDNRLENLELWSTSQPAGQRVVDKLAWAKEILALYGSMAE